MELGANDFKRLWPSLLFLIVCAVASVGIVMLAEQTKGTSLAIETKAQLDRAETLARLARARDDAQELREKIVRYRQIEARGLIGAEHRLDWLERIHSIKLARKLLDVEYELQPQQPIDASLLSGSTGDLAFMSSSMQLHLLLLHEEDLLNFLADLGASVDALIRVRQCNVKRIADDASMARLRADCTLEWITLRPKKDGAS